MFKVNITQTPFTSEAANSYFTNITGEKYGYDCSFLSTLRALLAPRMKEEESIRLKFEASNYTDATINNTSAERVVQAICGGWDPSYYTGYLVVHNFKSDQASNKANFELIESHFTSIYSGYHRLEKLQAFYRKSFNVDCYINPELKSVVVFVENLDNKKMHYLQVSILAMLPWYFDPKAGMSDEEMELVYSLRETTPDKYKQCLAKMAEKYDFRSARIRQLLNGFETRHEERACETVKNEIYRIDQKIEELNRSIGEYISRRNESCIRLLGLETKIAEGCESEIMDYFLCNHKLVLENVDRTYMYFAVKDYLEYFDSEMAENAINNRNSFVYSSGLASRGDEGAEKAKKLLTEIFVSDTPRLRIRFCAAYCFNLDGTVQASSNHDFNGFEFVGYMPNTHINRYQCMGNYETAINRLLARRDYIGAVEQCIASCKSLNWGDSIVMREFMDQFWLGAQCIELPDGTVVKPEQAIQWLEEQDKPVETEATASEETKEEAKNEQAD